MFYVYDVQLLAHLICLCLAMIVYAIHGSKGCCRWIGEA